MTSPGGRFDPGVYRVISYGGTLTDKSLAIGTIPAPSFSLQTAVAGQINLVHMGDSSLSVWDGSATADKTMAGSTAAMAMAARHGQRQLDQLAGHAQRVYGDGSFAIFMAAAGKVTVDNSLGQVRSGGMQLPATAIACWAMPSSWYRTQAAA